VKNLFVISRSEPFCLLPKFFEEKYEENQNFKFQNLLIERTANTNVLALETSLLSVSGWNMNIKQDP
jgi:hypothetical protein